MVILKDIPFLKGEGIRETLLSYDKGCFMIPRNSSEMFLVHLKPIDMIKVVLFHSLVRFKEHSG